MKHVVIDTDAGHDDALALMLLIKSHHFDIPAITTVAGNSTIDNVTRNAQAVLDLLGAQIPVYSGPAQPLARPLVQAVVHGESGLDGLDMSATKYQLTNDAPQQLVNLVKAKPGKVSILAIGPLTNVARCLQLDPVFSKNLKELVIMGGAINVPGNKNRVAEFNMFVDPEAADIVFSSDIKKIVVPLDPCNDVVLPLKVFKSLPKSNPLSAPLLSMMGHFISGIQSDEAVNGALVYDAIAAYYFVNPAAFTLKKMDVIVETKGEHTFGMTIAERRLGKQLNYNCSVVTAVDQEAFVTDLLATLAA